MHHAARDPRTARTLRWFHQQIAAATLAAEGKATSPVPRDELARRLQAFIKLFDREKAWEASGELGPTLRARAVQVAETLERQGNRLRGLA